MSNKNDQNRMIQLQNLLKKKKKKKTLNREI